MKRFLLLAFFAFSFLLPARSQDVGISSVISPVNGCTIGWDTIRLYLYNYSAFPIGGSFNICYTVGGGAPVCESVVTAMGPSTSYLFNFSTLYNFDTAGVYNICCTVTYAGDINPANDTYCTSITNDTIVVGGSVSGPGVVCASANSGVLILSGNNNTISDWQYSTDGGSTWNGTGNDSASYAFSNLPVDTKFRVLIDGGYCPDDYSSEFTVTVDAPSVAGTLSGATNVCSGTNSGQMNLTGFTGDTIYWQYSTGGPFTSFSNDTSSYIFSNLTQTTEYQVWVQNGVCPAVLSNSIFITVDPPTIPGSVTGGTTVCSGANNGNLLLVGNNGSITGWIVSDDLGASWLPPINNFTAMQPYFNLVDTMMYCAIVQSTGCPADTSLCDTIFVAPIPVANAGPDSTIYLNQTIQIFGSGGFLYNWSPPDSLSDPNVSNPFAFPSGTITYTLTVTDVNGCTDTDNMTITVIDTTTPPTPNLITVANFVSLNGDGLNDVWNVINIEFFTNNEVMVFNNQGQIVFSESNYKNTWAGTYNGDQLPDGSYFYVVKVPELNITEKGTLTLTSK